MTMWKLKNVEKVSIDDYILCEFDVKTRSYYYVGKVMENVESDGDIAVQFYKKQAKTLFCSQS